MQIKTTMRYHFTPVRMAGIQKSIFYHITDKETESPGKAACLGSQWLNQEANTGSLTAELMVAGYYTMSAC